MLLRLPGQQVEEAPSSGPGQALTQDQGPQGLHHGPHRGRFAAGSHQLLLLPRAVQTESKSGQRAWTDRMRAIFTDLNLITTFDPKGSGLYTPEADEDETVTD